MSKGWNDVFIAYTNGFTKRHLMTAAGISRLPGGPASFDLHHQLVDGDHVVRVDAWHSSSASDRPILGHWVPQGGSCLVPRASSARPFVFTPDFSGCSILVDQIDADSYRIYHVQGGSRHIEREYLGASEAHSHGLGLAAAMTFDDYGTPSRPRGFAFLKYEGNRWWIYYQGQHGYGLSYCNGQFTPIGPQTPCGGGRMPVADLSCEVPRIGARHSGRDLFVARNLQAQRRMLPNDANW
ncbi:MAG TPA: hypothetical protein VGZ01_06980 [Trinickia sp.]|nr:hypothetical protein [Trinickia sp.]